MSDPDERWENVAALRSAFAQFPSGVAALAARIADRPVGFVASSFTVGVSIEPPLVMFAVQNSSTTWPVLRTARRIGVSVLGQSHDSACRQLASRATDRFAGVDVRTTDQGAIFVDGAPMSLECTIENEVPAGDHQVVILRVQALSTESTVDPLVFHRSTFRQLSPEG